MIGMTGSFKQLVLYGTGSAYKVHGFCPNETENEHFNKVQVIRVSAVHLLHFLVQCHKYLYWHRNWDAMDMVDPFQKNPSYVQGIPKILDQLYSCMGYHGSEACLRNPYGTL